VPDISVPVVSARRSVVAVEAPVVVQARGVAVEQLAGVPHRLAHVTGVAASTARVVALAGSDHADELIAAAWVHDIGYAQPVVRSGFHPLDGAVFLRGAGFPDLVVSLVAYHSGAVVEAEERGLADELRVFPEPPADLLDVLTFADMTTSRDGDPVDVGRRLAEIQARYGPEDVVYRAISRSTSDLLAAVQRVSDRIAGA
jgi:hypothetical protein